MALSKRITLDNGVDVNYHRVVSVNIITNVHNVIEVASYTSEAKRREEQEAIQNGLPMDIYINSSFINAPYNQSMTVEGAYNYVKTLPGFDGARNVLD